MYFLHSTQIWAEYPELVPGVLSVSGVSPRAVVEAEVSAFGNIARSRLSGTSEGELPEIQAWRRVFSKMGLKPTQYRCAPESLLRRFKKENDLPRLHPLVDLCNAISMAYAIPIAVFDVSRLTDFVEVRHAVGTETYLTFSDETENPDVGEVIFADGASRAHARRWTNRQSGYSAIRPETESTLIVAEAVHRTAHEDMQKLVATLTAEICRIWGTTPKSRMLNRFSPRFEF
jgi:DNA/RNA-binding domain of Phe-tRNA-synthetase-like protein